MICHNSKITCSLSRSVADLDTGLVDHLAELRLTNSRAQEFPSIEQLEASRSEPGAEVVLRDITTSCVRLEAEQDRLSQRLGEAVRQLHSRAESLATSSN